VEFDHPDDAEDAVDGLDGYELHGQRITVQFSKDKRGRPTDTKCYDCGKEGHWARDCPSGDWSNRCYKCGQKGHLQTECTNPDRSGGRPGYGGTGGADAKKTDAPAQTGEVKSDAPQQQQQAPSTESTDGHNQPPPQTESYPPQDSGSFVQSDGADGQQQAS
jgi:RNA recognition motif-containing protein